MVNKKAFLKTLEAIIAALLLIIFISQILPVIKDSEAAVPDDIELLQDTILNGIQTDETLRKCAIDGANGDQICIQNINDFIDSIIIPPPGSIEYATIEYEIILSKLGNPLTEPQLLPEQKAVYAKNIVISSTLDTNDPVLLSLFLWRKI